MRRQAPDSNHQTDTVRYFTNGLKVSQADKQGRLAAPKKSSLERAPAAGQTAPPSSKIAHFPSFSCAISVKIAQIPSRPDSEDLLSRLTSSASSFTSVVITERELLGGPRAAGPVLFGNRIRVEPSPYSLHFHVVPARRGGTSADAPRLLGWGFAVCILAGNSV
jgi:hypothetical protein